MELLGVGPGEILLILVIMLLIFGPERLPEFARQAGRFVVRVRDWIQRSPDAAMVLRARAELESELQAIRAELTREVESVRQDLQNVRSDLADAGKLIEQSAQEAASASTIELPDVTGEETPSIHPPASATADQPPVPALQSADGASVTAVQGSDSLAAPADGVAAPVVRAADSAAMPEFEVDPGPIGARRARIAEVSAARTSAAPSPTPTIAGGETVARGARSEPASSPARVVTDDSPFAADMARIDALSRQVSSIAEELARLRVTLLHRMAEEQRRQNYVDPVSVEAPASLNGVDNAGLLSPGAATPAGEIAPADDTRATLQRVESSS
jgi:sec-independent protein translocase protein TatB